MSRPGHGLQAGTLAVAFVLLLGVVVAGWPDLEFALALEDAPLAWLQTSMLVACATSAFLRASLADAGHRRGWLAVGALLLLAALDDRFMGHERAQQALFHALGGGPAARHVAQGLTLLYLPLGAAALWWLRSQMQRMAWRWCLAGLGVGTIALGLDAAFTAAAPQVLEEVLEYVAETLFLCGLLTEVRRQASPPR